MVQARLVQVSVRVSAVATKGDDQGQGSNPTATASHEPGHTPGVDPSSPPGSVHPGPLRLRADSDRLSNRSKSASLLVEHSLK
jgi:hypothetical protein